MIVKTFHVAGSSVRISGRVVHDGPKGVVIGDHYREIWAKNSNGEVTERHSHGYSGDGWMDYFRAVCGV